MNQSLTTLSRCQPLLGTYVSIELSAEIEFDELIRISTIGFEAITSIQDLMSYHDTDSELTRINSKAHITPIELNPHTEKVIDFAIQIAKKTNGIFDPAVAPQLVKQDLLPQHNFSPAPESSWRNIRIQDHHISCSKPTHIDLGGIAKGYAVDHAFSIMRDEFLKFNIKQPHININAGGDLIDSHWKNKRIEIRHPDTGIPYRSIEMTNTAVATSSECYQEKNKHPIINPINSDTLKLNKSISIFSHSCMVSDALTKVYALSPESTIHKEYLAHPIIITGNEKPDEYI